MNTATVVYIFIFLLFQVNLCLCYSLDTYSNADCSGPVAYTTHFSNIDTCGVYSIPADNSVELASCTTNGEAFIIIYETVGCSGKVSEGIGLTDGKCVGGIIAHCYSEPLNIQPTPLPINQAPPAIFAIVSHGIQSAVNNPITTGINTVYYLDAATQDSNVNVISSIPDPSPTTSVIEEFSIKYDAFNQGTTDSIAESICTMKGVLQSEQAIRLGLKLSNAVGAAAGTVLAAELGNLLIDVAIAINPPLALSIGAGIAIGFIIPDSPKAYISNVVGDAKQSISNAVNNVKTQLTVPLSEFDQEFMIRPNRLLLSLDDLTTLNTTIGFNIIYPNNTNGTIYVAFDVNNKTLTTFQLKPISFINITNGEYLGALVNDTGYSLIDLNSIQWPFNLQLNITSSTIPKPQSNTAITFNLCILGNIATILLTILLYSF